MRLWGDALDTLERDPGELVGRLDWVTKRYLLETAGADGPSAVRKKIDLRYHELGCGYLAELERAGVATTLVTQEEADRAMTQPPESTPARLRSRAIRALANSEKSVSVSWDSVKIGGHLRGRIIPLRPRQRRKDPPGPKSS